MTATKLASAESGAGLPPAIPPGMRAMSVKVNDVIGVAGFIVPGSRVDVVVTIRRPRRQHDAHRREQRAGADRGHAKGSGEARSRDAADAAIAAKRS